MSVWRFGSFAQALIRTASLVVSGARGGEGVASGAWSSLQSLAVEVAVVDHAPGLELGARQRAGRDEIHHRVHAQARPQALAHQGAQGVEARVVPRRVL